jgi:hypothetical protein
MSKAKLAACMLLMLAAIDAAEGQRIDQVKRAVWEYCQGHDVPAIMAMIKKVKEMAA